MKVQLLGLLIIALCTSAGAVIAVLYKRKTHIDTLVKKRKEESK